MSKDQMQDVFPIVFDFKKGEAPTAEKLTGIVRQLDTGLAKTIQAIGDPWDQQQNELSLEKLTQSNIARIIGPADYLSPPGGSWNEESGAVYISLSTERNQWNLGFPLVKGTASVIKEDSTLSGAITPLTVADLTFTDSEGILTTIKSSLTDVVADGDYHIDFYTGTITSFKPHLTGFLIIQIDNLHFFGPGVPWSSANVIPTWKETAVLCDVSGGPVAYTITLPVIKTTSRVGNANYLSGGQKGNSFVEDTTLGVFTSYYQVAGQDTQYRLPQSIIDNHVSPTISEGYILLWDDIEGRVVPSVVFQYVDEHSLTALTPADWLQEGSGRYRIIVPGSSVAESINYLISTTRDNRHVGLTDGSLVKKTLFYSSPISHDTLTNLYSSTTDNPRYLFRQSDHPTNCHPQYLHRYGFMAEDVDGTLGVDGNHGNAMMGYLVFTNTGTYDYKVDSGLGTFAAAETGNTFGIRFGGTRSTPNAYASIDYAGGQAVNTFATATALNSRNPIASRLGFGLNGVGNKQTASTEDTGTLVYTPRYDGALYIRGRHTSGLADGVIDAATEYMGGSIGFDIGRRNELNYLKVFPAIRTVATSEVANQPAKISQTDFSSVLSITPSLTTRLCAEQIREFRVRGGAYLNAATNWSEGLASTTAIQNLRAGVVQFNVLQLRQINLSPYTNYKGIVLATSYGDITKSFVVGRTITVSGSISNNGDKTITAVYYTNSSTCIHVSETLTAELSPVAAKATMQMGEFDAYFTSPGMVGTDFLNLYSNAIFFSDTGDGKRTSFTQHGKDWLDGDTLSALAQPSGLYFIPGANARLTLSVIETLASQPFSVGNTYGLHYTGAGDVALCPSSAFTYGHASVIHNNNIVVAANADITLGNGADTYENNIIISAGKDYARTTSLSNTLSLFAETLINIESTSISMSASGAASIYTIGNLNLVSEVDIVLNASEEMLINAGSSTTIGLGGLSPDTYFWLDEATTTAKVNAENITLNGDVSITNTFTYLPKIKFATGIIDASGVLTIEAYELKLETATDISMAGLPAQGGGTYKYLIINTTNNKIYLSTATL